MKGSYVATGIRIGDEAKYECEEGYNLKGQGTNVCGKKGKWGKVPQCKSKKYDINSLLHFMLLYHR